MKPSIASVKTAFTSEGVTRKADRGKKPVTVYEIWAARKTFGKDEPSAPAGMTWVKLRGRPYFSKREYAELELEVILSKKNAKPADHYTLVEHHKSPSRLEREITQGRRLV